MSINLLELVKDQVAGSLAKEASNYLGTSEKSVSGLLDGVFPTLLGSFIDKGSTETGAKGIMDMIGNLDLDMLGDISGIFKGGNENISGIMSSGGGILEMLMGNKVGDIIDFFAKKSGMGGGTVSSLIKLAAPFLLGKIGGLVKDKGISALMDLLSGQKKHVKSALPAGVGSMLGLSSFGSFGDIKETIASATDSGEKILSDAASTASKIAGGATTAATETGKKVVEGAGEAAKSGLGFLRWLLPVIILAILAYFLVGKGCGNAADELSDASSSVIENVSDAAGDIAETAGDAASGIGSAVVEASRAAFSTIDEAARSALNNITFAANSAGKQMLDFVNGENDNPVFRFNNLTFATGSATIDEASVAEVDNIAAILKAYPGVRISIEGYTDNTGDPESNKILSQARAESVKARLLVQGVDSSRMEATGYGDENPVADNNTEEGREQNRRIEIKIISE